MPLKKSIIGFPVLLLGATVVFVVLFSGLASVTFLV
jgi:hypothetical protein